MNTQPLYIPYIRMAGRRLYPMVVLRDALGLCAGHPARTTQEASLLTEDEVALLKTFDGACRLEVRLAKPGKIKMGTWKYHENQGITYMMGRPDPVAESEYGYSVGRKITSAPQMPQP